MTDGKMWLARYTVKIEAQLAFHGAATRIVEAMTPEDLETLLTPGLIGGETLSESEWRLFLAGWRRAIVARENDWEFVTRVSTWLDSIPAANHRHSLSLANWLASDTRGFQLRPKKTDMVALVGEGVTLSAGQVFAGALYVYRPRFMYQFKDVRDVLALLPVQLREHAIFQALETYSILGTDQTRQKDLALDLADKAVAGAKDGRGCGCLEDVVDVCVQAYDLAQDPDALAVPTIELIEEFLQSDNRQDGDIASVLFWRRGRANRRLAFLHSDNVVEATELLDKGIRDLARAQDRLRSDTDFSQGHAEVLIRERETFERDIHVIRQMREMKDIGARVAEAEFRIERESSASSIRSVEVLSLFSSAVAFAVGVAAIGATAVSLKAAVAIGLFLLIGLTSFAVMIMVMSSVAMSRLARYEGNSEVRSPTMRLAVALSGGALVAALICIAIAVYFVLR